ncbi:YceI family protein [Labilibaculum sp.]|uniref:YceI family protein n=1 Tax=Labilibaculum sp. TaxID=2060723 RepID=UPI002AA84122|nr:YceI family protein [Labilibaculum sp.]
MKTMTLLGMLLIGGTFSTFAQKSEIKLNESAVKWTGNKIGGSHEGEIQIKSGYFELKDGDITSGEVVMDMNTITNTDIKDEGYNQKLVGHLKSDDFFGVENFPTSTFVVSSASKFEEGKAKVSGTLTIKGKTESIFFDLFKKGNEYSAQLKVDRSKYNVRYGSNSFFDNLGDKAIDDIFILEIKLVL